MSGMASLPWKAVNQKMSYSAGIPGLFARIPQLAQTRELRIRACKALAAARAAGPDTLMQVLHIVVIPNGTSSLGLSAAEACSVLCGRLK